MKTKPAYLKLTAFNYVNVKYLAKEAGQTDIPTEAAALLAHNAVIRSVGRGRDYETLIREYFNPNT